MVDHGKRDAHIGFSLQEFGRDRSIRRRHPAVGSVRIEPCRKGDRAFPLYRGHLSRLVQGRDPSGIPGLFSVIDPGIGGIPQVIAPARRGLAGGGCGFDGKRPFFRDGFFFILRRDPVIVFAGLREIEKDIVIECCQVIAVCIGTHGVAGDDLILCVQDRNSHLFDPVVGGDGAPDIVDTSFDERGRP